MELHSLVSAIESPSKPILVWEQTARETSPRAPVFEDLALPLLPSVYNLAFWLSHNATDAEDLVQETFLKALRGFDLFQTGTNFKAWIFHILRNTYLSSCSSQTAKCTVALEDKLNENGGSGPGQYPGASIDRETSEILLIRLNDRTALYAAMEKLAPPLLEVILLCDVEELKYREIATVLEIPLGTVISRIARARAALRKILLGEMTAKEESQA